MSLFRDDELGVACRLLRRASKVLCTDDPEQGDYCNCGAYVGRGEAHRPKCLYLSIQRFLKRVKESSEEDGWTGWM